MNLSEYKKNMDAMSEATELYKSSENILEEHKIKYNELLMQCIGEYASNAQVWCYNGRWLNEPKLELPQLDIPLEEVQQFAEALIEFCELCGETPRSLAKK